MPQNSVRVTTNQKTLLQYVGLTKLIRAINHATEDLQQRLLDLQI